MTIDIRSVLLADGVSSLVFLSISAFTWRRGHGEIAGPGYWFLGFCCLTAGLGMVALRGLIPDSISIVIGNLVLLAGVDLQLVGIFRYLGLKRRSLELVLNLLLIVSLAHLLYFEIAAPSLKARMIGLSIVNAVYGAAAVHALLFRCPEEVRSYARASAAFWAAFTLIYLARVALGIEWKAGEDWMAASSTVDSYAMVLLMMTLAGVAATEMLLLYGKVESTLRVTAAELKDINAELGSTQREIMITLSEIVEFRSKETASHVARVGEYSRELSLLCGRDRAEADLIGDAAPMHDIGKISIPDDILNKSSALEPAEVELIQSHTVVGYKLLSKSERPLIRLAAVIALEHHERWAGGGYPTGKRGRDISFAGRAVCLCDVFDALASTRPYKAPWDLDRILEYIRDQRGAMFDPELVDAFLSHIGQFVLISEALNQG